jgi:hypothetical protein
MDEYECNVYSMPQYGYVTEIWPQRCFFKLPMSLMTLECNKLFIIVRDSALVLVHDVILALDFLPGFFSSEAKVAGM